FKYFNATKTDIAKLKITPENFGEFIALVYGDKVNSTAAQIIFKEMFARGGDPSNIMEAKGLAQMEDASELKGVVTKVISGNEKAVAEYKAGKQNALQFLVGKVMAASRGKANPQKAQELLLKILSE
ncbi:Asp-tRNA(Asn)/Glu-tRNA(Gln) amidotransferase GatCAB subunit B, partial [Candidatus Falkowbacteria bacterium CG10_big_fil_rev_8_21_14_0_10_44_15]